MRTAGPTKLEVMHFSTLLGFIKIHRKSRDSFISRTSVAETVFPSSCATVSSNFSKKSVLPAALPLARVGHEQKS